MKIKHESAPEKVVKHIHNEIKTGVLSPGDKLPTQQELATRYGIGRSSVREAINALVVMGLVEVTQGSGTYVKDVAVEEIRKSETIAGNFLESASVYNLMEIREVLECHAVRTAAGVISEESVQRLQAAYRKLEHSQNEPNLYLKDDIAFHREIANAVNNPDLGALLEAMHVVINKKAPIILKTAENENLKKGIVTAKQIVRYIIEGDAVHAERAMKEHLNIAKEALLRSLFDDKDVISFPRSF